MKEIKLPQTEQWVNLTVVNVQLHYEVPFSNIRTELIVVLHCNVFDSFSRNRRQSRKPGFCGTHFRNIWTMAKNITVGRIDYQQ